MSKINLLSKSVSELIAAGEVVERPASAVKETVENSIDAGARRITVEIKRGGITFIRITDDGCGISREDVPTAFLRHATSKISSAADLDSIRTLGFRGEALAAIAGVSRIEMLTKTSDGECGTHYVIEGGREISCEEAGCPEGTTLIIRDLFYNTPARMKFLKKDSSEGTAVGAVTERAALSHPEIAFKFIKDEKLVFSTSGDGNLSNAIYSVLGRDFHSTLIPVKGETDGVNVSGFTCKPVFCRASRAFQFTFLNGRYVVSRTVMAAAEQAYRDSSMVGKFPGFVLFVNVPYEAVDVNVHPAKTEVRFSDERRIFSAVYYAVKSAVTALDTRPEISAVPKTDNFFKMTAQEYRQTAVKLPEKEKTVSNRNGVQNVLKEDNLPFFLRKDVNTFAARQETVPPENAEKENNAPHNAPPAFSGPDAAEHLPVQNRTVFDIRRQAETAAQTEGETPPESPVPAENSAKAATPAQTENRVRDGAEYNPDREIRLIGEAFLTYIIVQRADEIYLIDKHAAHERVIYNKLKSEAKTETQILLSPVAVSLTAEEHAAALSGSELLLKAGFEIEDFGNGSVLVRTVPAALSAEDVADSFIQALSTLKNGGGVNLEALDDIYHTVACKAAIKAGYKTTPQELLSLAKRVLENDDVMYCPHGRPVAFLIKKTTLEKYFGRIQ